MTTAATLEIVFWCLSIAGFGLMLCRLYFGGLIGTYRYLAVFAGIQLVQSTVLLGLYSFGLKKFYGYVYLGTSPLVWLTYILVVLELYNVVLQRYEGLATVSRKVLRVVFVLAILASVVTLIPEAHETVRKYTGLATVSMVERGVVSSLVFFLLMIGAFLLWFPVQLSRNAIVHTGLCCLFFLNTGASFFFRDVSGMDSTRAVSTAMLGVGTLCLFLWAALLQFSGEQMQVTSRPAFVRRDEERLMQQLNSVNAALLRSSRK